MERKLGSAPNSDARKPQFWKGFSTWICCHQPQSTYVVYCPFHALPKPSFWNCLKRTQNNIFKGLLKEILIVVNKHTKEFAIWTATIQDFDHTHIYKYSKMMIYAYIYEFLKILSRHTPSLNELRYTSHKKYLMNKATILFQAFFKGQQLIQGFLCQYRVIYTHTPKLPPELPIEENFYLMQ